MGHIYGIDLGTTNSLIGDHATGFLSEIVPSVVDMENGRAGSKYYEDMSAMRSFKIDMSMGVEGLAPRKASKFVLKELASKVTCNICTGVFYRYAERSDKSCCRRGRTYSTRYC